MPDGTDNLSAVRIHEIADGDALRLLNRSPHPYHRKSVQLTALEAAASGASSPGVSSPLRSTANTDDEGTTSGNIRSESPHYNHSTDSDSGTEADDEHFLKGLPAPKLKGHKGLRNEDGSRSGTPSPLMSPDIVGDGERRLSGPYKQAILFAQRATNEEIRKAELRTKRRRKAELRRRAFEVVLLGVVGIVVISGDDIQEVVRTYSTEFSSAIVIVLALTILYPLRLIRHLASRASKWPSIQIPDTFDPAPLLYPPTLPVFAALLLANSNPGAIILNITLSLASLPAPFVPSFADVGIFNAIHWAISCVPIMLSANVPARGVQATLPSWIGAETLVYIYPLHQALCVTLNYLTTTSLLTAELQLLSIALINVLLLSVSPQAVILKALLWGGGVGIFVTCGRVLSWVVALARVPKWRFKRTGRTNYPGSSKTVSHFSRLKTSLGITSGDSEVSEDDEPATPIQNGTGKHKVSPSDLSGKKGALGSNGPSSGVEKMGNRIARSQTSGFQDTDYTAQRRHTLPIIEHTPSRTSKRTPSGRRRRAASSSTKTFFKLTEMQATIRKWLYAIYVYILVLGIILVGIREYVARFALHSAEPLGWALGYLFGNLPQFRMEVLSNDLERWICLPAHPEVSSSTCRLGWVSHLRLSTFGPANTRLLLLAYWGQVLLTGLAIVFRLSAIYEVDTRRKVFHFMMVAMLLPAIFVDPTYAALALSLVLAVFLLLDLFRASQLPPLSRPLAYFLAPYVDGRDLRGPVVISHIFLLIGCAIPLWLSLGALSRTGDGCSEGWEVLLRDTSMVAGVICVGMGDAAASLIGRRFGRHKWFWAGGKSIEGSVAFAVAVWIGLLAAKIWLVLGEWQDGGLILGIGSLKRMMGAAVLASLTEAVLTGGNDNVVCPLVLWLCVKGLKI